MKILSCDPGTTCSGWAFYDSNSKNFLGYGIEDNETFLNNIWHRFYHGENGPPDAFVYEMIASYGMPVGATTFDTCVWTGRFIQCFHEHYSTKSIVRLFRKDVKINLCKSMKAKDANVRQALIDRFGPPGTKKSPGKLFGVKADMWSACALAVTYADILEGVYEHQLQ